MARYTLSDFNKIWKESDNLQLSDEIIKVINNLAIKVGAPEYIKTPQFKNSQIIINGRRKKKSTEINNEDWETIRAFQTTEFKKKEGIENNKQLIRKYLNMITKNTYLNLKENIIAEIREIYLIDNNLSSVCNEIFTTMISNILYSDIYVKLYKDLISEFNIFYEILLENFNNFESLFQTIEYISPESDYNKFCENNKNNEIRRSTCSFYINSMKEDILDSDEVGLIILNLFTMLNEWITTTTKKNELDELSEILNVMIINGYAHLNKTNTDIANKIYDNIIKITNMKCKDNPGITNKCIFKHMDILDEIS